MDNDSARENGVEENKLLPYPIAKKFFVPAYVPSLKRVLFVKNTEQFFEDIGTYINKHGSNSAFELSKSGKGFSTRYKAIYDGPAEPLPKELEYLSPRELDPTISDDDVKKAMSGQGSGPKIRNEETTDAPAQGASDNPADFKIPFGTHKGKSIKEVYDSVDEKGISKAQLEQIIEKANALRNKIVS